MYLQLLTLSFNLLKFLDIIYRKHWFLWDCVSVFSALTENEREKKIFVIFSPFSVVLKMRPCFVFWLVNGWNAIILLVCSVHHYECSHNYNDASEKPINVKESMNANQEEYSKPV